ncbi:MAG: Uncharacterized protein YneG, partial [uncultured Gemmatimonadetes bacterium]
AGSGQGVLGAGAIQVPQPLPVGSCGPVVPRSEGDDDGAVACRGLRGAAAGAGVPGQGWQADALSRPPGVRGAARHRHLLPRMPGEVARHPRRPRAHGRGAGARGEGDRQVAGRGGM